MRKRVRQGDNGGIYRGGRRKRRDYKEGIGEEEKRAGVTK